MVRIFESGSLPKRGAALALTVFAWGCVSTAHYMVSAPAVVPLPLQGRVHRDGQASLRLGDLGLELAALDYSLSPRYPKTYDPAITSGPLRDEAPSFLLQVVLKPGKAGYAFDPTKPTVRTPDGRVLSIYAYVGPGKLRAGLPSELLERGCFGKGGDWKYPEQLPRTMAPRQYPISEKTCFVLGFDFRVQAGLTLVLDGLDSQGVHLKVPNLLFVRRDAASTLVATRPMALEPAASPRN